MPDLTDHLSRLVQENTPAAPPDYAGVGVRAQARSRRRATVVALTLVILAISGVAVFVTASKPNKHTATPSTSAGTGQTVPSQATPQPADTDARTGPLPDNGAASCIEPYNLATLKQRAFAFDGTVTETPATAPPADPGRVAVTFRVNEWFRGHRQTTVTISMIAPTVNTARGLTYEAGTRLLVTGETEVADRDRPLTPDRATAWACGFTHYYDKSTAAAWRQVF